MDIILKRADSAHPDFKALVISLDRYLTVVDGEEHDFYHQFNQISDIQHVVIAYSSGEAIGCGAIKKFSDTAMEVKRMYVAPSGRNSGVGTKILTALEAWAKEMSYRSCVLETGKKQPDAIRLYQKNGYREIPNYEPYIGVENSICFEKIF